VGRVIYTHINHTNPLADPDSIYSRKVRDAGFEVAYDGMTINL
jgi:pyrroloquinoline quinone biosynthesis protein B